jgi:hypothetical protein
MIQAFIKAKRRVAWQSRLDRSSLLLEADCGERVAIWVFDSRSGPDGYVLRDQILQLAKIERLKLFSFGPRDGHKHRSCLTPLKVVAQSSDSAFSDRVACCLDEAAAVCGTSLFIVGACKGTFAGMIPASAELWEVQHGLLDPSYFPVKAHRFFARSSTSLALLSKAGAADRLTALSDDLSPPRTVPGDIADAKSLVCYSKNPGGGCTTAELTQFERSVEDLARRLGLPYRLKLHPRDNPLKLTVRHRRGTVARYLKPDAQMLPAPRLVVSSFSTALTAETRKGDLLMNVVIAPLNPIIEAEYNWLPTVCIDDLIKGTNLSVVERL